jgi:hypothetical protein
LEEVACGPSEPQHHNFHHAHIEGDISPERLKRFFDCDEQTYRVKNAENSRLRSPRLAPETLTIYLVPPHETPGRKIIPFKRRMVVAVGMLTCSTKGGASVRRRTDPLHVMVHDRYCSTTGEIAMNLNWIENGWQRFLDRLKKLWGKREDPDPAGA